MSLGPLLLEGFGVRLEPLQPSHAESLLVAASDPEVWRWMPSVISSREDLEGWIAQALAAQAAGTECPFAVVDPGSGRAIGSTRYLDVSELHRGVEVGWTWYSREHWGSSVNPASKYLLLKHAFETWGAIRVCLKTDSLNARSRAAILKLGARYEGDLRNHRIRPDGSFRHSSHYSILDSEWPEVSRRLLDRINPDRG